MTRNTKGHEVGSVVCPALTQCPEVVNVPRWLDTAALADGMLGQHHSTDALPLAVIAARCRRWPRVDAHDLMPVAASTMDSQQRATGVSAWS